MAKILLYSDIHFCETSSIVTAMGSKYTKRLEQIIKGINWAEELAEKENCDEIFSLGDFFDKRNLTAMELTALKEINWSKLPHRMLCGNHEGLEQSLIFNSVYALRGFGFDIIDEVKTIELSDCQLVFIPYITESIRKNLTDYLTPTAKKRIILSHNDVAGIRYGSFESKNGFSIEEIDANCNLFLNGHLHNGTKFSEKGINLGNFCGQNFTENAAIYDHSVFILDTEKGSLEVFENPYALNFYQIELLTINDFKKLEEIKNNSVLSIKCAEALQPNLLDILNKLSDKIIAKRIVYVREAMTAEAIEAKSSELKTNNYLNEMYTFATERLGTDPVLIEELSIILGGN